MRSCNSFTISHMKSSTDPAAWFKRSTSFWTPAIFGAKDIGCLRVITTEEQESCRELRRYILDRRVVEKILDESPPLTPLTQEREWEREYSGIHPVYSTPGPCEPRASSPIRDRVRSSPTGPGRRRRTTPQSGRQGH